MNREPGDGVEADPYFTPDGRSLYFISTRSLNGVKRKDLDIWRVDRGSDRPGGLGGNDIWRARTDAAGKWAVENLGPAVNTAGNEYEPLPSADGVRLIVMGDSGLYESRKLKAGWSP